MGPINCRTQFVVVVSSALRRDLLSDTCRADVSICNRKYLHWRVYYAAPKRRITAAVGLAIETAFIIPRFHSRASLSETGSRKLYDPSLRSPPLLPPGKIIPCPTCTLISRRRATPLLRRCCCGVFWKRRWNAFPTPLDAITVFSHRTISR